MEIFKLFGKIGVKTDEAEKGMEGLDKKGKDSAKGLGGAFGKLGGVLAGAFAVDKIIDFGRGAIEAAADADAMSSQFKQVFGDMTGQAKDMSKDLSQQFGMIPEQLQPGMVKFQGMFKGVGMSAKDAMDSTEKATTSAADAAAFANVSYEDAQGSLQSFIMGNYEAGDAIGIQANDNAIAQYAIQQGAVKSTAEWQKMGDAQKMQMRLGFVEHTQELSGVTGQAQRESKSWAVQVDKLKASWKKFMAIIGTPILKAVLPIVEKLADWMGKLGKTMTSGSKENKKFMDSLKPFVKWFKTDILPTIMFFVNQFKKLWGQLAPYVKKAVNKIKTDFMAVWNAIKAWWDAHGRDLMKSIQIVFSRIVKIISGAMKGAMQVIKGIWQVISGVFSGALQAIGGVIEFWSALFRGDWKGMGDALVNIGKGLWKMLSSVFKGGLTIIGGIFKTIGGAIAGAFGDLWAKVVNSAKNHMAKIKDAVMHPLDTVMGLAKGFIDKFLGLFGVKIKWPHIPMPTFSISPAGWKVKDLLKGKIPRLGVSFNAEGGIMDGMTAMGMYGGNMQVGGEAGREAIIPLKPKVLAGIGKGIADEMDVGGIVHMLKCVEKAIRETGNTYLDGQKVSNIVENRIMKGVTS
ncbi:gp14 [Listeria phage P40]|uniref:gp14 n=1 Tax=Listeria phage P40 TaxID=560178 RepID=UPI00018198D4|nr:gp14 [Listeria phage P40]ACI00374.1 gp14 [Listeria phage P40]